MAEVKKTIVKCNACGKQFSFATPAKPGRYSITCSNPECKNKISFTIQAPQPNIQPAEQPKNIPAPQIGLLEDGSYRFICTNPACKRSVKVPADQISVGHNRKKCPNCNTPHEFDIQPTEQDLLKCQTAGCSGILTKPDQGDGIYSVTCPECQNKYTLIVQDGKVIKATLQTPTPIIPSRQFSLKLVTGNILGKKEYNLSKGMHYVGRSDQANRSDFSINDKYASSRSIRIDVNENGGSLVYKLIVERATNPVYHNNKELTVGDIVYITSGDTIKLGKTVIKVQKAQQ